MEQRKRRRGRTVYTDECRRDAVRLVEAEPDRLVQWREGALERCGSSPVRCHTLATVMSLTPITAAIRRGVQSVSGAGGASRVLARIFASTRGSMRFGAVRGVGGRGFKWAMSPDHARPGRTTTRA